MFPVVRPRADKTVLFYFILFTVDMQVFSPFPQEIFGIRFLLAVIPFSLDGTCRYAAWFLRATGFLSVVVLFLVISLFLPKNVIFFAAIWLPLVLFFRSRRKNREWGGRRR